MSLLQRLTAAGPKRILALDGGGIRGALSLGFLERIEQLLRVRHRNADLRLCDYFDLIGGTSTGAIIAAGLAIGLDASELKRMYLELGGKVFGKRTWRRWEALFEARPLERELAAMFGERTLGDPTLTTGLCIVTKRADTGSTWPLNNHPNGTFFAKNKDMLLRQVVRASTAAPVYFAPVKLDIGGGEVGAFVDGGVSMANNPALQLLMLATLRSYPFRWPLGEHRLLLVSVGTGIWRRHDPVDVVVNDKVWDWARQVPLMLIDDASWHTQLILQSLTRTATPWEIDAEIGDLRDDQITPDPVLTYLRYDTWLEPEVLIELGLESLVPNVVALREMSAAENRFHLAQIGERAAKAHVEAQHFPSEFDVDADRSARP
jgi:uncharacterized protein